MGKLKAMTYDDYAAVSDGKRYELIHGELVEMAPAPNELHQRASMKLSYLLMRRLEDHVDEGFVYAAPIDVILDAQNSLQPDLVYISADREEIISRRGIDGAPDVVIEILSPSTRDRDLGVKMGLYFQHGVREYWIVDTDAQTLALYQRESNAFTLSHTFQANETLKSGVLPDFSVFVGEFFKR